MIETDWGLIERAAPQWPKPHAKNILIDLVYNL